MILHGKSDFWASQVFSGPAYKAADQLGGVSVRFRRGASSGDTQAWPVGREGVGAFFEWSVKNKKRLPVGAEGVHKFTSQGTILD